MAKSVRSKSQRRNRAALRENVYKPHSDARTLRLSAKQALMVAEKVTDNAPMTEEVGDNAPTTEASAATVQGTVRPSRSFSSKFKSSNKEFNFYGVSKKETRF